MVSFSSEAECFGVWDILRLWILDSNVFVRFAFECQICSDFCRLIFPCPGERHSRNRGIQPITNRRYIQPSAPSRLARTGDGGGGFAGVEQDFDGFVDLGVVVG